MALLHQSCSVSDELIHNGLGGLLFIDNSGHLAHQEGTGVVHHIVINIIGQVLKVVLDGDDALGGEVFDFL